MNNRGRRSPRNVSGGFALQFDAVNQLDPSILREHVSHIAVLRHRLRVQTSKNLGETRKGFGGVMASIDQCVMDCIPFFLLLTFPFFFQDDTTHSNNSRLGYQYQNKHLQKSRMEKCWKINLKNQVERISRLLQSDEGDSEIFFFSIRFSSYFLCPFQFRRQLRSAPTSFNSEFSLGHNR